MKIYLLTHSRELTKKTNSGQLALNHLKQNVERIIWDRVSPNSQLLDLIARKEIALLHPQGSPINNKVNTVENFLIIDSTWQEANKIFNRSPHLKNIPKFSLQPAQESSYALRRNQPKGGLCTAECIIELLKTQGEIKQADFLQNLFVEFNQRN